MLAQHLARFSGTWLVVMTSPRKGASYVEKTVAAIDAAGGSEWPHKVIVSDGPAPVIPGWRVIAYEGPTSCQTAFFRILNEFSKTRSDYVLFQDDLEVCKGAIPRMLNLDVPMDCAFFSFADMANAKGYRGEDPHVLTVPVKGFWGHQCVKVPRKTIRYLSVRDPKRYEPKGKHSDVAMAAMLEDSQWPRYALHTPSLVNHIGLVSTWADPTANPHPRLARNWPGSDFDASSLGW